MSTSSLRLRELLSLAVLLMMVVALVAGQISVSAYANDKDMLKSADTATDAQIHVVVVDD